MSSISPTSRRVAQQTGEHDRPTLLLGKPRQRGTEAGGVVAELRQIVGFSLGRFPVEPDQDRRVEADRPSHAHRVDREIAGDREQPTHHAPAAGVVGRCVTPGTEKRLLGNILGGAVVGDDRARQTEDATLEAPDERRRSIRVAGSESRHQRVV